MTGRDTTWLAHVAGVVTLGMLAATIGATGLVRGAPAIWEQLPFLVELLVMLAVGWVLAARRPRNPLGWLLIAFTVLFSLMGPATYLAIALEVTAPLAAAWIYALAGPEAAWSWVPPVGILLTQVPLRFPDGRLPSPRWRGFSWFSIAAIILLSATLVTEAPLVAPGIPNPLHTPAVTSNPVVLAVAFGMLATAFAGSIASLFVRYRRGDEQMRAQLRWMLWAVALAVLLLISAWVAMAFGVLPQSGDGPTWIAQFLVVGSFTLIPVAIGVAVLRYRLYEIDRVISRTAAYAIVTVVVIAVYVAVVTSATWLLPAAPAVAVAGATLAAAAVFLPVLRGVQRVVDRRFDRARYDGERIVDAFGERLRIGADPHAASTELLVAAAAALQPRSHGLWIATGPAHEKTGAST